LQTPLVFWLLPIALVLLAGWVGSRGGTERIGALQRFVDSRYAPIAAAILTMIVIWYVWGSLNALPIIHDEASYLIQAQTFARGRWTMPSPPLPEFFEQFHVFVVPHFASKYPPGHGILMVPGIWLGFQGLVPLLLNGLAAALLFVLVRRVTNGWVALLTFLLWLTMSGNLAFRSSYFSETTSSVLWLAGWLALLEWGEKPRERWLMAMAACIGWMAITRPLTAVAFALPIGAVVLWRTARAKQWRTLVRPIVLGVAILSLIPIWSARTTGNWRETPYSLYSKLYFPFDAMGFGFDSTPPERQLPPDMRPFADGFGPVHVNHTLDQAPSILLADWKVMFVSAFRDSRLPLAVFAVLSLAVLPVAGWFAIAGSVLLTFCYLAFAHPALWDLYYLEIFPLLPFLTACGMWATWLAITRRIDPRRQLRLAPPQAAVAAVLAGLVLLLPLHAEVARAKAYQLRNRLQRTQFTATTALLPGRRTMVFVHYAPNHSVNNALIENQADLANAKTWLVHDLGVADTALLAKAPDRTPYMYDEYSDLFYRLTPAIIRQAAVRGRRDSTIAVAKRPAPGR
jgi:hypothetical protein